MKKRVLIGGAWPYANYNLHIGHLVALLPADVIARFHRNNGAEVVYVSGSDCHGTPITERAKKEGKTAKEIAEYYHNQDVNTFKRYNFSYEMYTATMTEEHKNKVKEYFMDLYNNGHIFEKEIEQEYCNKCNTFLSDREIVGTCPVCGEECNGDQCDHCLTSLESNDVKDKKCKSCKEEVVLKTNKHLYFKLSAFQDVIQNYIEKNKKYWRKNAVGETQKFLDLGLIDRAATRQLDWGVEVPIDGFDDKRIYVWIEAVLGYLTTGNLVCQSKGIDFEEFMKDDGNLDTYYVHGKDNIPFHTVIFPSLIKGINRGYQLPKYIVSSHYMNMNDEKMSKSKGNLITADELADIYDIDSIRYYLIANNPEQRDVSFSHEDFIQTHNKFLVGILGNFVNRNLSFINKKFDGVISKGNIDENIREKTKRLYNYVGDLIKQGELRNAIAEVIDYASMGNKYYDEMEPWKLVKEDIDKFNDVSFTCAYIIANLSNLVEPFMPRVAKDIKEMLSLEETSWNEILIENDIKINNCRLLFERIEEKSN